MSDGGMDVLATGVIAGGEARGSVRIVTAEDARTIELLDLWVSPGAPDVRLYTSPHLNGTIDDTSTELGLVPYNEDVYRWPFPTLLGPDDARSIVIFCGVYSVQFGHAELEWLAA